VATGRSNPTETTSRRRAIKRRQRRWQRLPLSSKLAIAYTVILLGIIIVTSVLSGIALVNLVFDTGRNETGARAQVLAGAVSEAAQLAHESTLRAMAERMQNRIVALYESAGGANATPEAARQAQERAEELLLAERIGTEGYFYVLNSEGIAVVHPVQELRDQDFSEYAYVQNQLAERLGYFTYQWANPGESEPRDKTGYMFYFEPWDWIVTACDYVHGLLHRVPPGTLAGLLNSYTAITSGAAVVRGQEGGIIAKSNTYSLWRDEIDRLGPEDDVLRVSRLTDGTLRTVARARIEPYDASVTVLSVARPLQTILYRSLFVQLLTVLVIAFAVWIISQVSAHRLVLPIQRLGDRAAVLLPLPAVIDVQESKPTDYAGTIRRLLRALVRLESEIRRRRLAETEVQIAETVFKNTTEGIIVADAETRIIRVNPAFTDVTGFPAEEAIGRTPAILQSGRHSNSFYQAMWDQLRETGVWYGETWNRRRSGEEYAQLLAIRAVKSQEGEVIYYVAVLHDISGIKKSQERLQQLATHDTLTALPNRAYLTEVLKQSVQSAQRRAQRFSVLFLDLDNFKDINDTFGHGAGDQLLVEFGRRLKTCIRGEDIVGRFGGDEFIVILPDVQADDRTVSVARRILAASREPVHVRETVFRPSVSIGIAVFPEGGNTAEELLRNADVAMYQAKREGRAAYVFHDPGMNREARARLAIQDDVRKGVQLDEFTLQYQPIVDAHTLAIRGAEALIRWTREGKNIGPEEFIPYLENSSAMLGLGRWVLETVASEVAMNARHLPADFYVSINVTPTELTDERFSDTVLMVLEEHHVSPSRLCVEVTESAAIRDFNATRRNLSRLQDQGVFVYLDDFGEGHASLGYLREFGVDAAKLDKAFLVGVPQSERATTLVRGFIALAHGLGLRALVEGVETDEQIEFFRHSECDLLQGFRVAEPMTFSEVVAQLAREASPDAAG
jgi:diguanylate cyclase (GGDEF)-like protein/PAS domain S-box-containing protein